MKTLTAVILAYLIGAFLTNAYCQTYRWEAWKAPESGELLRWDASGFETSAGVLRARQSLTCATLFWPAYWASRAAFKLVSANESDNEDFYCQLKTEN